MTGYRSKFFRCRADSVCMIRGLYTGASGMAVQQNRLDAISNNLANADTTAYKTDQVIDKAFPELLLHRMNTNVTSVPHSGHLPLLGSVDKAPLIGKLGMGVETNEVFTQFTQGSVKDTKNQFDFALNGKGFLVVQTPEGERLTRNGGFLLGPEGYLVTKDGYPVLGENGPIQVKLNNITVDEDGKVFQNNRFNIDPKRLVSMEENEWDDTVMADRLKIVQVDKDRYLKKVGNSMYLSTEESGEPYIAEGDERPKVIQGYIETSNVNPVSEMVKMIEVNRAYEACQKAIQSQDQATEKLLNQVYKV